MKNFYTKVQAPQTSTNKVVAYNSEYMNKLENLFFLFCFLQSIMSTLLSTKVKTNWLFHIEFYFRGAIITVSKWVEVVLEKGDIRYFTAPIMQADNIRWRVWQQLSCAVGGVLLGALGSGCKSLVHFLHRQCWLKVGTLSRLGLARNSPAWNISTEDERLWEKTSGSLSQMYKPVDIKNMKRNRVWLPRRISVRDTFSPILELCTSNCRR